MYYPVNGPSIVSADLPGSTLDLLRQPFAFTQASLLTASQFVKEAKRRGLTLELGELEQLHRRRVLVPFYRVHTRPVAEPEVRHPTQQAPGTVWQLYEASVQGRLSDPSVRRFTRWPRRRPGTAFYYSYYQLLSLRSLRLVLTKMKGHRGDDGRAVKWELERLSPREREQHARSRALAFILEVLSPRYRPPVTRVLRSPDDAFNRFVDNHDPIIESEFLSADSDLLLRQADALLVRARSFDPLGSWHRVTRIAVPRSWDDLRNDALIAQEQRVAAEMILAFLEDEARHGRAKPLEPLSTEWRQPRHDRLRVDQRERAETIMDFALSDRPAVYVAVEGQTEATIVANVLGLAGFDRLSPWVAVVNLEGVGGDVNLLARAVAVPRLDPDGYRGARLLSPLTALIVVADPEGTYATAESRERVRKAMIEHVMKSLPSALRTDAMRQDLHYLLHVRAWNEEFEFAHFSNTELARALRAIAPSVCPTAAELRRQLKQCRESGGAIKSIWKNWRSTPSKVALAQALWPDLERRILNSSSRRPVPVVDLVEDAIRISYEVRQAREMAPED